MPSRQSLAFLLVACSSLVAAPRAILEAPTQTAINTPGSEVTGEWKGVFQADGNDITLTVTLKQDPGGAKSATVLFDEFGNETVKEVRWEGTSFTLVLNRGLRLTGTFSQDGSQIRGTACAEQDPEAQLRFMLKRAGSASTKAPFPLKERYRKLEAMVPMRDGVQLYTAFYVPKDLSVKRPVLLQRTPYSSGPYGAEGMSLSVRIEALYLESGYILAFQDVRGRFQSQGTYQHIRPILPASPDPKATDESTDAYDTVDWIVRNLEGNSGKVGIRGLSYPGFYAAASLVRSIPRSKPSRPRRRSWTGSSGMTSTETGRCASTCSSSTRAISGRKPTIPRRFRTRAFRLGHLTGTATTWACRR